MNPKTDPVLSSGMRKPWLSLFFATAGGLGYLPKAPGTWGAFFGVALAAFFSRFWWILTAVFYGKNLHQGMYFLDFSNFGQHFGNFPAQFSYWLPSTISFIAIAATGVWISNISAAWSARKDPQWVVIDEVSGQHLTMLLGAFSFNGVIFLPSWKYWALGFILFRVFDIWKPFPVRQAESLPGGWGIMADDWIAAVYAAIGIWLARAFGL